MYANIQLYLSMYLHSITYTGINKAFIIFCVLLVCVCVLACPYYILTEMYYTSWIVWKWCIQCLLCATTKCLHINSLVDLEAESLGIPNVNLLVIADCGCFFIVCVTHLTADFHCFLLFWSNVQCTLYIVCVYTSTCTCTSTMYNNIYVCVFSSGEYILLVRRLC